MKERIDTLLVNKGFFESREKARASIMMGVVFVDNQRADKPGTKYHKDSVIEVRGNVNPYVSRGGLKLAKALSQFKPKIKNAVAMDVGASTGGFTDCLLQNGAKKVYAVDVGYGQLAWQLRQDPRVVTMERTNIRYVEPEDIQDKLDFVTIDVSFISLKKVLPAVRELLNPQAQVVCLIKPQFEAGRDKVGKNGVVRDPKIHQEVINDFINSARDLDFYLRGLTFSPITGPEGNIEYLAWMTLNELECICIDVQTIVSQAHESLVKKE